MESYPVKKYFAAALALGIGLHVSAQKLPSEQKEPMYAPVGIKIDGKATEWGDKFQAHSNATQLFYTLANDADNLYVVMQTDQQTATDKIFYGGISLVIKSRTDKKALPLKMTYPLVSLAERSGIAIPLRDKNNDINSVMALVNGNIVRFAKHIAIAGFKDVSDPDVSVFNELSIKADAKAGKNRAVTFEFQLPLKYFAHLLDDQSAFDYSIIVNGAVLEPGTVVVNGSRTGGGSGLSSISIEPSGANPIFSPTNLKGTYILVKK